MYYCMEWLYDRETSTAIMLSTLINRITAIDIIIMHKVIIYITSYSSHRKIAVQQFAVKIPINSDNFPIINFPVSQHVLYYCTYYSVSFACTVHCTYYIYCTLYIQYMFPVSLFPMLRFHLQHLFTCVFTYHLCSHHTYHN